LLNKFISKSGRPFAAYLVVDDAGKVGFEFASPETSDQTKKATEAPGSPDAEMAGE
jgi:DNA topoisomerase III